jgi:hypothetical protein
MDHQEIPEEIAMLANQLRSCYLGSEEMLVMDPIREEWVRVALMVQSIAVGFAKHIVQNPGLTKQLQDN